MIELMENQRIKVFIDEIDLRFDSLCFQQLPRNVS